MLALALFLPIGLMAADHALTFTNNTHYVSTTGRVSSLSFTIEAWVKPTTFIGENQVASQYDGSAGRMIVALRSTKASFFIGGTWLDGNATLTLNAWTHVAVTRTGSTANIYVNGALDKTLTTFPSNALPSVGIMIGGISSFNNGFRGQLAEIRAWNVVRTQTQIQGSMSNRLAGSEANLAGYWRLDEGMGTFALDHAANANGTITGATWAYGVGLPVSSTDPSGSWRSASGGNWSDTANWVSATSLNGVNGYAFFTNNPPSAITVTNNLASLQIGRFLLSGSSGYTFTGNALTLTNQYVSALISSTNGSHTFGMPITTSAGSLLIEARSPASVAFANVVSGPSVISINPITSGGGTVALYGANTFTSPVSLGSGTLTVGALVNAGLASSLGTSPSGAENLLIGSATLRCAGPSSLTDRGLTMNPGSGKATLISVDTNVTFGGTINSLSGAFIKRGKGILSFTGTGPNVLSRATAGNINYFVDYPSNGDSPTNGFGGLNVTEGKLILGAAGQTNTINGEAWVGTRTTSLAGKETTGELEIDGGYTRMNSYLCIGRDNGTTNTAATPLQPVVTLNSGTLSLLNLIVAYSVTTNNARPVLNVRGGSFEVDNEFRIGDQRGDTTSPEYATVNVFGGAIKHTNTTQGIVFGWRDPSASGSLNLFGGIVDEAALVKMGQYGSRSDINLHGGILRAQNIVQSNPNTNYGQSYLFFNGGVFQPVGSAQTLSGLTTASVSTNGALIDTTYADYSISQSLLHDSALGANTDGGLIKLGTNALTFISYSSSYTGPTIVSNGLMQIAGLLPSSTALTVADAGEVLIGGSATQVVSVASLTLRGNLDFAFASDGSTNDSLSVASSPRLGFNTIGIYIANSRAPFAKNGTYTVLTYKDTVPDVSNLTIANPVFGKTYAFAASGGNVTLTIGLDSSSASIWSSPTSGAWGNSGNWTLAPDNVNGGAVRFDSAISTPVTVQTAGEAVRQIFINNVTASYTLGGTGLLLTNDATLAAVTVESGTHTISAPLTLASNTTLNLSPSTVLNLGAATGATLTAQGTGALKLTADLAVQALEMNGAELGATNTLTLTAPVKLTQTATVRPDMSTTVTVSSVVSGSGGLSKAGSNVLALASANTYTGVTRIDGGTIIASTLANGGLPSSIGASSSSYDNLILSTGTLRYTGPSVTIDRGYTLNPGALRCAVLFTQNDLTFAGRIQGTSGGFIKTGPGTLYYTYPGAQTLGANEGNIDVVQNIGPFGDTPTNGFQSLTISNGKVVVGVPGQTNTVNGRMCVGQCTTKTGTETAGELEIDGGVFTCSSTVSLGRSNGTSTTAPGGISSRITINGGAVNFTLLALGYNNVSGLTGFNARPICDVNAGTLTISTYCNLGEIAGSTATLNVRGGTVLAKGFNVSGNAYAGFCVGGPGSGGTGILNISGTGVVTCVHNISLASISGATGTLNLNGGFLSASNIVKGAGSSATLRFNGGVFQPGSTNNAGLGGLTAAYVSTNGALIDTSLASYTVAQNLLHEPGLGILADGGLVKLGTNILSLIGTNTMNGLIDVRAGALLARVSATNDVNLATNTLFDALGLRATVGDLTGSGTLTNGIIAVTGRLDAGTNGAPAGAKMTVQNLSLVRSSTFACDCSTNGLGQVTNDFVAVTGALAAEGPGFIDFGRTQANPISTPFNTTILSFGTFSGSFAGWKAINTGLSAPIALVVTAENNLVKINVRYSGTLLIVK